ncbi:MAG: hypothetical protein HY698_22310 [Deltaproteobacteria bacterium]|nr:hypothetical protein [Deltaproteobacteria bacterium]
MRKLVSLIAPSLFALVAGCGGDSTELPSESFKALQTTACKQFFGCKSKFPGKVEDFEKAFGKTEAECVTKMQAEQSAAESKALDDAVEAGRVKFHEDQAEKCIDGIAAVKCDDTFWADGGGLEKAFDACEKLNIVEGTIANGKDCTIDEECVSQECDAEATKKCVADQ